MKKILLLSISIFLIAFSSAAITDDLVSYYSFEESSGDLIDIIGGYDQQVLGNPVRQVDGIINFGYNFSNVTLQHTEINETITELTVGGNFTMNVWYNSTTLPEGKAALFTIGSSNDSGNFAAIKTINGFGNGQMCLDSPNDSIDIRVCDSSNTADGLWHMATGIFNTSGGHLYIDGVYKGKTVYNPTVFRNQNRSCFGILCRDPMAANFQYFDGRLDEAGLWSRAITETELAQLYNSGNGLFFGNIRVILISPEDDTLISTNAYNFTANYTSFTGNNLTNATYYIWNSTGIFNRTTVSITGLSNTTTVQIFNLSTGNYLWNVLACAGNAMVVNCSFAANNFSFSWQPFEVISTTFNATTVETAPESFNLLIETLPTVSSVSGILYYDGTGYSSTTANPSSGQYSFTNNIDIPLAIPDSENKEFFWEITTTSTNGLVAAFNTSTETQFVQKTSFFLCNITATTQFINFTTRKVDDGFPKVNATFKSSWEWFIEGGGDVVRNVSFEDLTEMNSTWRFCMIPTDREYDVTSTIEFDATGYALNWHYLENAILTNTAQEIDLYLLNDSLATLTELLVRGDAQIPKENVLVQIQLFDVGTNTFRNVAMAKTSSAGTDLVYLNWYDSFYKFIFVENGETILITEPYKISETPQIFDILSTLEFGYEKFLDFQYTLTFNELTENFILTYVKPSGLVDEACLRVIKRTLVNDTQLALVCDSSSSGTLFYNIGNDGNGTFIGAFYATGSLSLIDVIEITVGGNPFSSNIYLLLGVEEANSYAVLLSALVVGMFLINAVFGIIGIMIAVILSGILGFTATDYMVSTAIVIGGFLLIWFIKR